MKKKMLLVGIGDYRGLAATLVAPVQEIARWEQLLRRSPYGFESIRPPLLDREATKENVLQAIDELLTGAEVDDQLLFLFVGHGTAIDVRGPGGSIVREQVLLAYPDRGDLRSAGILFTDVAEILRRRRPPDGADVTFVLESCFARGVAMPGAIPLFVSLDPPSGGVTGRRPDESQITARRFIDLPFASSGPRLGSVRSSTPGSAVLPPGLVIVTAARETEAAYQVEESGNRFRLLFSKRVIGRLTRNRDTFDELIQNVNPLRQGFPQNADAHGTSIRRAESFPGAPGSGAQRGIAPEIAFVKTCLPSIRMRFLGMGCFIGQQDGDYFKERIVVPYDNEGVGMNQHFAFVEVAEEDILYFTGTMVPLSYYRGGVWYKRWDLTEHLVMLNNPDTTLPFTRSAEFTAHAPLMPEVCPELADHPRESCRDEFPDGERFTAFFDLQGGGVDNGYLEQFETQFVLKVGNVPTAPPIRTPTSVIVTHYFEGDRADLTISDESGTLTAQIFIRDGAMIMAGNAREDDILGDGSGDNDPEHFLIYYQLADPYPINPAVPTIATAPVNACSITRWP